MSTSTPLPIIPVILGPTGVGKSSIALALAQQYNQQHSSQIEIVNLDSVAIYRGLNIGAAKPTLAERQQVAQHLLDVAEIDAPWTVADYQQAVAQLLPTILQRGKLPLLVGGSMLYYQALTRGLSTLPATSPAMQQQLQTEEQQNGLAQQYHHLGTIDPLSTAKIHHQDRQRIHRALAVYYQTGLPLSRWQQQHPPRGLPYRFDTIIINDSIAALRARIQIRFQQMLQLGWLDEVRELYQRYHHIAIASHQPPRPLRSVGYRQLWDYYDQKLTLAQALQQIPLVTGQLAKRQQTWLRAMQRNQPQLVSYNPQQPQLLTQLQQRLTSDFTKLARV